MIAQDSQDAQDLLAQGFVHLRERHASVDVAWERAQRLFTLATERDPLSAGMPALKVVGEFTLPPRGAQRREFQPLHIDFGLPIDVGHPVDAARFTALYVDPDRGETTAQTRIVLLRELLRQRAWPDRRTVSARLGSYGEPGGVEGILARLVEAVDGRFSLPSSSDPGFLCGMEFDSFDEEQAHFSKHALALEAVEHRLLVRPGELLVFDNLRTAHGRHGRRAHEELHQLCVGYSDLDAVNQARLLSRVLDAFEAAG